MKTWILNSAGVLMIAEGFHDMNKVTSEELGEIETTVRIDDENEINEFLKAQQLIPELVKFEQWGIVSE